LVIVDPAENLTASDEGVAVGAVVVAVAIATVEAEVVAIADMDGGIDEYDSVATECKMNCQ
jgi:hypothetical protein